MATSTTKARKATTETSAESSSNVTVIASSNLRDPFTKIKYPEGVAVPDTEVTGWVRAQIDAGVMAVVE